MVLHVIPTNVIEHPHRNCFSIIFDFRQKRLKPEIKKMHVFYNSGGFPERFYEKVGLEEYSRRQTSLQNNPVGNRCRCFCVELVKLLPVNRYSDSGPSGILGSDEKQNTANAAANCCTFLNSHEQTQ